MTNLLLDVSVNPVCVCVVYVEVTDDTLQLVSDHYRKIDVRLRKMVKAQNKESHMIQSHDHQDAQQVAKVTHLCTSGA